MRNSTATRLIHSLQILTLPMLVLSALGGGTALAAAGGIPGPPHVTPVSPCISTGFLQEDDTSIGAFFCSVRNVGVVSHNVMIDIRDGGNLTDNAFANSVSLAPGHGTILTFPPHRNFTAFDAYVVSTDEGTTDAL